jgi:hypothetical protein
LDFNYLAGNNSFQRKHNIHEHIHEGAHEDSFHPDTHPMEEKASQEGSFCSFIDPCFKSIIEIFSPVLNFMTGITEISPGSTKEETIDTFNKLIIDIESKIGSTKMSKEAKETLARVYKSVGEMESRKDLDNLDLNELILRWKETKDHKALIHMHEKIKNGECVKISNEKMRKVFLDGLEAFADSLDEALGHPPSEERNKVVEKLQEGASAIVNNVDIVNKRGGDENLTLKDKKDIARNFQTAKEKTEEVISDPNLSKYITNSKERLTAWSYLVISFLEKWLEEIKESEKQEKKEREEKICAYRLQKKKEADNFHAIAKSMLKKANNYFFLKEEMRRKIYNLYLFYAYNKSSRRYNLKHKILRLDFFNKKFLEFLDKEGSLLFAKDFANFQIRSSKLFEGYIDCSNHDHK